MWLTKLSSYSIKRQLAVSLYLGMFIIWLAVIIGSFLAIRHEVDELYDGELSQLARVLMTLYASDDIISRVENSGTLITAPPFEGQDNYENKLIFQIWGNNKTLLVRSSNAPETPISSKLEQSELNHFYNQELFGNKVRVYSLWIPKVPFVVHVGQKLELRTEIAYEILESFYLMFLIMLPVLLIIVNRAINKGIKPLNIITDEITQRTSDNLEPVDLANVPEEIKGLTASLNKLFTRLGDAFSRERQFIADAAHELRTPLAGLKAQAQIGLQDKSRVEKSLNRIVEGVDRTSRLANQLLSLSRLDAEKAVLERETIRLKSVIDDVCNDLQLNENKSIEISKNIDADITVTGNQNLLYTLVRNLLDNSIRYSDKDPRIQINLYANADKPVLEIIDNGPGIAEENLDRIFDRFYRELNTSGSGSGLGLAIVKRITELMDINISVTNNPDSSGLLVKLRF